jgi:hypothetical protein
MGSAVGSSVGPIYIVAPKNNFAAIVGPEVTDDSDGGYEIGSRWIDTVLKNEFVCMDATVGAADWRQYDFWHQ